MKTKYLMVSALGVWTAIVSFWVISPALVALRVTESSDIAMVLLVLGALLTVGGSRIAWDGYKRFKQTA